MSFKAFKYVSCVTKLLLLKVMLTFCSQECCGHVTTLNGHSASWLLILSALVLVWQPWWLHETMRNGQTELWADISDGEASTYKDSMYIKNELNWISKFVQKAGEPICPCQLPSTYRNMVKINLNSKIKQNSPIRVSCRLKMLNPWYYYVTFNPTRHCISQYINNLDIW